MTDWIDRDLVPVLDAVTILSPVAFRFGDDPPYQVSAAIQPSVPGVYPTGSDPLVSTLQGVLYARCYSRRLGDERGTESAADSTLVSRLSQSNRGQDRWDYGWRILQALPSGQVFVTKGDRQRSALPGEYITDGPPGVAPRVGALACLRVHRESFTAQAGFYHMYGESPPDVWDEYYLARLYLHCRPEGVADLVAYLTAGLNRYQMPYQMKALSDPASYPRTDAMVVYFARRYFPILARIAERMPEEVSGRLGVSVPLFSKPMRAGMGLAEDPRTGESFGMHRCRLTAEGIVDAWRLGDATRTGQIRAIARRFAWNGLTLERPYLNPGSIDLFELAEAHS